MYVYQWKHKLTLDSHWRAGLALPSITMSSEAKISWLTI